jgi:hypothetical protein
VLRYPEGPGSRSGLDASEQGFEFDSVRLRHPITRLACPTGRRKGRTRKTGTCMRHAPETTL